MFATKKELTVVLAISAILLVSGCIEFGDEEITVERGLEIISLDAIPSEVFSGDEFELILDVINTGDMRAEGVNATILQARGATNIEDFGDTDLDPPMDGFDGERHSFTATLNAPEARHRPRDLNVDTRVHYKYKTDANLMIPVMDRDEYRSRIAIGENIPDMDVTRVSNGPFDVDIGGPSPALIEPDDTTFRFYIHGENIGNGRAYYNESHPDPSREDIDTIHAEVSLTGADWADEDCSGNVTVRSDSPFQISCEAEVSDHRDFQDITVDVMLYYGYYIDESTTVLVREEV